MIDRQQKGRVVQRLVVLVALLTLATATACDASWNPFSPHQFKCEAWNSVHPPDTTHSTFLVASHPDSTNCRRSN